LLLAGTLALAACSDEGPAAAKAPEWTVGEPTVRIGSVEGDETALTDVTAVLPWDDGSVFVASRSDASVRRFAADGSFLGSFGRPGDGPGEFRRITAVGRAGDRIWVLDGATSRFTFFTPEGELLESRRVELPPEPSGMAHLYPYALGPDGRTVYAAYSVPTLPPGSGVEVPPQTHLVADLTEGEPRAVVTAPWGHTFFVVQWDDQGATAGPLPWRDAPLIAADPRRGVFFVMEYDTGAPAERAAIEVTAVGAAGDTLAHAALPYVPVPLLQTQKDSALDALAAIFSRMRPGATEASVRSRLADVLYLPETHPPLDRATVDESGRLWLRRRPPEADGSSVWMVLDGNDLSHVADVRLPAGFELEAALAESVWGVERDDLDVPFVVHYPLVPVG